MWAAARVRAACSGRRCLARLPQPPHSLRPLARLPPAGRLLSGSLKLGCLSGNGNGSGNGHRAAPAAIPLTYTVPPKKADPPAAKAEDAPGEGGEGEGEGEGAKLEARLADAVRDAQVKLLKARASRGGRVLAWPLLAWNQRAGSEVLLWIGGSQQGWSSSECGLWLPCPPRLSHPQERKCDSEEERSASEELQAQLLAAHPCHLPLLLERMQRAQRAADRAGKGGEEAAALQARCRLAGGGRSVQAAADTGTGGTRGAAC